MDLPPVDPLRFLTESEGHPGPLKEARVLFRKRLFPARRFQNAVPQDFPHQPPVFLHHPLIRRPDGTKLSKANGDTGLREPREAGLSAAILLGDAACRSGLIERPRPVRAAELAALFAV